MNVREVLLPHTLLLQGEGEFRWVQPAIEKTHSPSLLTAGKIRKSENVSATGEKYLRKTYIVLPDKLHNLLWRKSVVCVGCLEQKGDTCGTHRKTPGTQDYRMHV